MTRLSRIVLHENIMVAATVAIGAFVFRPRQLIGYDRLLNRRDAPFEIPTEIWKLNSGGAPQ